MTRYLDNPLGLPQQESPTDRIDKEPKVNPSEAIYGFAAWLTTRADALTIGSNYDAAPVASLVNDYCISQGFSPPREGVYPGNLKTVQRVESEKATDTLTRAAMHYSPQPKCSKG